MRINHLALALLLIIGSASGYGQGPDSNKVNDLATAISHAEGFGRRGTIPSRYHNPGDLKANSGSDLWPGQVGIGKAGHIVFKNDEAGKAALRQCILKMMDGRSTHFRPDMTFNQVARVYAENWRPWLRIVSLELGVSATTTLQDYFEPEVVTPEVLDFRPLPAPRQVSAAPVLTFPAQRGFLAAMLEVPVHVPPLVEDTPQKHRFQAVRTVLHR